MRATGSTRRRHWGLPLAALLALLVVCGAYANHFDNSFHFDDSHVIVNNLAIRSLESPQRFFADAETFTSRPQNAVYRPLLTLSYALDYRLGGGLDPRAFHRTQFALLLVLAALLFVLFRRLLETAAPSPWNGWLALGGATLFSLHTANTQTVNYLSSRSSLGATLGVVAGLCLYVVWPAGRRFALYLLPVILGGLTKPLAVMFAPLLLAYLLIVEREVSPRRVALRVAPAFVLCLSMFVFLRSMDSESLEYAGVDRWTYALSQPWVWLHYLRLFLIPIGLTADTDWQFGAGADTRFWVGCSAILIAAIYAFRLWRRDRLRPLAFGLAWFGLALLPTSSIVPLSEVYNEHRIFFPYVGLTLAFVWTISLAVKRIASGRRAVAVGTSLIVGLIGAHAIGTHVRNRVWLTEATLWRDVAKKSPGNARGLMNYGLTLMRAGELDAALEQFERSEALNPDYEVLQINLGIVKTALDRASEAEAHFHRALRLAPDYAQGHFYHARWLIGQGRAPEALEALNAAVRLSPGDAEANRQLLEYHAALDQIDALRARARQVLQVAPNDTTALAYLAGDLPDPPADRSASGFAREAGIQLGRKEWLRAAVLFREALERDADRPIWWNDLGWALASAGLHGLAIPCYERAIALDPQQSHAPANLRWSQERLYSPP